MKDSASIKCRLDIGKRGKRVGALELTHSDDAHSFSVIPIPIAVIVGGPGPTVLLTAGVHGDEYEGQVILRDLIHDMEPDEVNGRLIILPALNGPAVRANARVSPLDGLNLNRVFPGLEDGLPTQAIAHFVTSRILPLCDAGLDLHSGGAPADYLASAFLCTCDNREMLERNVLLAEAFGAPVTHVVRGEDCPTGFDPVAHSAGVPFISAELSGGGGVDIEATRIGRTGTINVCAHLGMIDPGRAVRSPTRFLNGQSGGCTVTSPITGIFEPLRLLGDCVGKGEPAGRVFALDEIDRPPLALEFAAAGKIIVKRTTARVVQGDHLYVVASDMTRDEIFCLADCSVASVQIPNDRHGRPPLLV